MSRVVVLYEDQLSKDSRSPNGYVPHLFMLHCVSDRTGVNPWSLKEKVGGLPRNGVARLKKDLDSPHKFRPHGEPLILVADSDRIHEHFGISAGTPEAMCAAILQGIGSQEGIEFFLLVRNLETLVEAAARKVGRTVVEKSHTERDGILGTLLDPSRKAERKALVAEIRMLEEIVAAIERIAVA